MSGTVAQLSDDAIARLGADAYLLEGSRAAAERLLREAAARAARLHPRDGAVESEIRAALAQRHLHHHHRHHGLGAPTSTIARLGTLTPRQRTVLVLRHVDGLGGSEIGIALGLPARAVDAALGDALVALGGRAEDAVDEVDIVIRPRRPRGGTS
ncbi:sigma factor-like helix-turn-helix DNA-binding protein [Demequina silvatica]|uniref:sigma-70 region 4 domain-containing protein n=1 Tax=Demequina silvatica TaxID=1638988 RepID=UPI0007822718|nr:sigma-70 region 4 domain-containing protein [Demequina silvatica]